MFLVMTSLKAYLESVVTCRAVADGQASADEVVLDVDDQKSADGANDLIENNFFFDFLILEWQPTGIVHKCSLF